MAERLSAQKAEADSSRRVDAGTTPSGQAGDRDSTVTSSVGRSGTLTRVERAERELVEILLSAPELVGRIREQLRSEEIRDTFLKRLLEVCYQIHDNGGLPTFDRVTASLEDPEMKRLLVKIDEEARSKETSQRVTESELDLLEETVQVLKWRREREKFETERAVRTGRDEAAGGLDDEDKARLRRAFEHHQKRTRRGVVR